MSARRTGLQEIKERDEDCSPHRRAVPSDETAARLPHRTGGDETAARLPHKMGGRKVHTHQPVGTDGCRRDTQTLTPASTSQPGGPKPGPGKVRPTDGEGL